MKFDVEKLQICKKCQKGKRAIHLITVWLFGEIAYTWCGHGKEPSLTKAVVI